ncbi:DUF3320 domain-containing protein [Pseudomonas citronellolis]|uniref:DUF3320 domain-containing protein n=1 Tax=Pseudomonas citronellolis TaxID=53408 RepID=UPI00209F87A5|nr:DUF3320 domain-containing protein [Pseudomonas citronellolis]MCP1604216.1 very-short-patch-repair endonuclease [Pseudomonas citronellolis]MCP1658291.1 very-short-patch-repair endonuclease [Pseudomonas citronellolis]MCP1721696.1 very-short-patch-repair endonuclease [Pseudomonas citronellolis]
MNDEVIAQPDSELPQDSQATVQAVEPAPIKTVRIQTTLVAKLNLADFQNSVPVIRELRLVNDTDLKYNDLELQLLSDPLVFKPKTWHIDALGPGTFLPIPGLDLQIDGALLARLTETESATVTFVLTAQGNADEERQEVARHELNLELLPRSQWGGLSHLPDMTAAFVQPNDIAVERLLKKAAEVLRAQGKNPALNGYSGGSAHAWEIASAIWAAVASLKLDYALPPASFEQFGQKVRSPNHILESGLATCFDLSLLFCAALEQAGLNPLLIFTRGHAFAGFWLKAEEFSNSTVDDITALRKRIKLNELKLFETTLITQPNIPSLSYAIERGTQHLAEGQEHDFELALDIRRARLQRIKPLASAEATPTLTGITQEQNRAGQELLIDLPPDLPDDAPVEVDTASLDPKDRLARWQRKLLDLSLRNNLLNFKAGKKAVRLEAPDAAALEDILASGQHLKLLTRPDLMDGADPRDQALHEEREREDLRRQHALDALKRNEVFVGLPAAELDSRLTELYRGARTNLQEGGSNTLFLALGFLTWTREDRESQRYRAPLILVPVTLERKSARAGFTLVIHDDEPRFNPTLQEMLRQDFELSLGISEGELPKDSSGLDVALIWRTVAHAVKDIKGWEVSEDVVLSMFSFAKYLMWKDLSERSEALRQSPVVRHLLDTPRDAFNGGGNGAFPAERMLDTQYSPQQIFCPLPSDSSQLSAVLSATQGHDFVLIGPPGTGKSQTIVNMIAQFIAQQKRVLFVSEKIAALDVVYRRLREVGLGEFCLEVHSNKSKKTEVLSQLHSAWEARGTADAETWQVEAQRLQGHRDVLNLYVERLHKRYPNGYTIYNAIGIVSTNQDIAPVSLAWTSHSQHQSADLLAMREIADRLEVNAQAVGFNTLNQHPLHLIGNSDWSPTWQHQIIEAARELGPAIHAVQKTSERYIQMSGLPSLPVNIRILKGLATLTKILPAAAGQNWGFVLRPDARAIGQRLEAGLKLVEQHRKLNQTLPPVWTSSTLEECQRGLGLLALHAELKAGLPQPWPVSSMILLNQGLELLSEVERVTQTLSVGYSDAIEALDVQALLKEWEQASKSIWPKSWLTQRRIRGQLANTQVSPASASVAEDLQRWIAIRELRARLDVIDPGQSSSAVWKGFKTDPALLVVVMRLQASLAASVEGRAWADEGFDLISQGQAGTALKETLERMREVRTLEGEISTLDPLALTTGSLWAGLQTQAKALNAAAAFQRARRSIQQEGRLEDEHELVASGACGEWLQGELKTLRQREAIERELNDLADLRELTTGLWLGLHTKEDAVARVLKFHVHITGAISALVQTPEHVEGVRSALGRLLGDANALLEPEGQLALAGEQLLESLDNYIAHMQKLVETGHFLVEDAAGFTEQELSQQHLQCEQIVQSGNGLHAWCAWKKACDEASTLGLLPLVDALKAGHIPQGSVRKAFETNYARWWLNTAVDHEPVIRSFVSVEHEQRIRDFRALDDRFTALTRDLLRARLCAELPTQESVSKSSEWGILRHEITKKTRHLPLRELMSKIPDALTKLTPCLLMSPLSIAQYLAANSSVFDVVIFDEASQIPVWDAIGAIARGKQVVMVGDPKQLPPTSFFDRAESTQDDGDIEADLESILDECISANLPIRNLNWHYRSRHESLIAFSNQRYYESKLVTFPSPVTTDRAVSLHIINGVYEKGSARTNPAEAKALVNDLISRLRSPGFRESKLTIGVVTFNGEQQKLIEDLLDTERRKDPTLESYFSENELEPVFVKNLESVQGDERDIMYFSITYGPDAAGNVAMNFGPLNRTGGERRLNVAVTRARHELRVFSTLRAEKIDLARTQALGVRDLKHFLEFAERGARALAEVDTGSLGGYDSPFEEAVANALRLKGWQVVTQVGVSSFRIDLGVIDPDAPGRYLAGIECDGATYHRSATARDRDKLREQVLRGLGWEILRIWSTDWWIDSHGTAQKIHERLEVLLAESRQQRVARKAQEQLATITAESEIANSDNVVELHSDKSNLESPDTSSLEPEPELDEAEIPNLRYAHAGADVARSSMAFAYYRESDPLSAVEGVDPDAFFDTRYDAVLDMMIKHVIEEEGPILDTTLARRIARAHGWTRTGARIRDRVANVADREHSKVEEDVGQFYWPRRLPTREAIAYRRPADATNMRSADEICSLELLALARALTDQSLVGDDLLYAMARELGLSKVSASSRARIQGVIDKLLS